MNRYHFAFGLSKALLVFLALFSSSIISVSAQEIDEKDIAKLLVLDQKFAALHVDYDSIKPRLRNRLALEFADQLDPDAMLLTKNEVDELMMTLPLVNLESVHQIQNYLNNTLSLVRSKMNWLERKLNSIKQYNFFESDSMFVQSTLDTLRFPADTTELNQVWKNYIKLRVLQKSARDSLLTTDDQSEINKKLNTDLLEIIHEELCKLDSKSSDLKEKVLSGFMRAYAKSFDPHSDYFSSKTKDRFLTSLSNEMYSTGLIFDFNGSKFVVTQIIPFSDASNYKNLKTGDEIISVYHDSQWVSLHCLTGNEITALFTGHALKYLDLEIRSSGDQIHRNYHLEKRIIANVSNHIYKFILKKEDLNIGYVMLPSFYSDLVSGSGSAGQDLAVVLLDLNNRKLDGLIVDLRNNGGGSMQEAIDLSGFFVDYGPLFITTDKRDSQGLLHKDSRRGRIYKGKVVFMVNTLSASASELVVSAMRHYPDQLIVGSPTFGKSTSQSLLPLTLSNQARPYGMAKITTSRMYNIKGASYQGAGVQPDIELPVFPTKKLIGESSYRYSLKNKPISKSFRSIAPRDVPTDHLRKKYIERQSNNKALQALTQKYDSLEAAYENGVYFSLDYFQFKKYKQSKQIDETDIAFEVETLEDDDTFLRISGDLEENAAKDPILNEVFRIFDDWITYNQN